MAWAVGVLCPKLCFVYISSLADTIYKLQKKFKSDQISKWLPSHLVLKFELKN